MNNNASVPESFRKIQTDQYELPRFIVAQMLPTGVHLFAGSPKIGKSWLVLWLCDKIAKGEKVWEFDTQQCTVLYIALEDTKSTLHFRIEDITEIASEKAFAVTLCSSLSGGLLEEIDGFVARYPDTGLVVIDTLQLVRDPKEKTHMLAIMPSFTNSQSMHRKKISLFFWFIICAKCRTTTPSTWSAVRPACWVR